jgi:hypothetical protein
MQLKLHATSYTETLNSHYQGHPVYQYIQINLQENILKSILVNIFLSTLRSKVPPDQHTRYLVSRQNMVCASRALTDCITHIMPGVPAGATWNDQQSYWLCLPCRRKSEGQVGCMCRRERGGGRSSYSLYRRFAQSSKTTTPYGETPAGGSRTGRVKTKKF